MGVKDTANLALIPAAYKTSKVYSALPTDGDGDFTFTRTGSGTRINKAGLIETMGTNIPRLNYRLDADGNVSSCPELLLEPSRQNKVYPNNSLTSYSAIGVTNSNNQIIAPNGTNEGAKITATTSGTAVVFRGFSGTASVTHNISVFLKAGTHNQVRLQEGFSATNLEVNLTNGNIILNTGSTNLKVEKYPNDWYRVSFDFISASSGNLQFALYFKGSYSSGSSIYIYGGQIEQGSGVTSLIPTTSGAITRNKDSAYKQPFADLASDYPITVYAKAKVTEVSNTIFSLNNTSSQNYYLVFYFGSSTQVSVGRGTLTANDFDNYNFSYLVGDTIKVAVVFISATAYKLYIDGIEIANVSSGTSIPFNHDDISLGQFRITGDTGTRNPVDELFIWNKALTDAEMVEVTSYTSFTEMATQQQYTIQ